MVDIGCKPRTGGVTKIAHRLICFVLRWLFTAYVIPVGYFFTGSLKHDCLSNLTLSVLKAVEEVWFMIIRIAVDNPQKKHRHVSRHVG